MAENLAGGSINEGLRRLQPCPLALYHEQKEQPSYCAALPIPMETTGASSQEYK